MRPSTSTIPMKLTPIRIKGKGGPKQEPQPRATQRAIKRPRDQDDEGGGDGNTRVRSKKFRSRKPAAPIEELPTEILERIVFLSGNLNFLRSSLRLGYRFSSPSFLTALLGAAFAPTWDALFGHTQKLILVHHHDFLVHQDTVPGDPDFQVRNNPPPPSRQTIRG